MAMRIDEARQHGAAFEVHHARPGAARRLDLLARPNGEDAPAAHRDCLGRGLGVVHGDNRPAAINRIRLTRRRWWRLCLGAAQQAAEAHRAGAERKAARGAQNAAARSVWRRLEDAAEGAAGNAHDGSPEGRAKPRAD